MKIKLFFAVLPVIISLNLKAQQPVVEKDEHHHSDHEHHRNEIGVANSVVYFVNEKEISYGLHVHYTHTIAKTKFGIGAGYERIFDEHGHNTFGLAVIYSPVNRFNINLSPGLTFEDQNMADIGFALHLETSYEFEFKNFHLGPSLGFGYDAEDYHIGLGVHIGFGF
jgi:hypothetical protein